MMVYEEINFMTEARETTGGSDVQTDRAGERGRMHLNFPGESRRVLPYRTAHQFQ